MNWPDAGITPSDSAITRARAHQDLERILLSRGQIAARIAELGREIGDDLDSLEDDVEVVLIPILTGSIIFVADLLRHLPQKLRLTVVTVTSYPGKSMESIGAAIAGQVPGGLDGKFVLIVDDILDSGKTIRLIRREIGRQSPRSVRACVLLRKTIPSAMDTPCEYVGFDIPDEFVVGYGLDYDSFYRNLPDVGVLKEDAL